MADIFNRKNSCPQLEMPFNLQIDLQNREFKLDTFTSSTAYNFFSRINF